MRWSPWERGDPYIRRLGKHVALYVYFYGHWQPELKIFFPGQNMLMASITREPFTAQNTSTEVKQLSTAWANEVLKKLEPLMEEKK